MEISIQILELFILALSIAAVTAIITRRLRLPYTVGLVIIGLILGFLNRTDVIKLPELTGDLIIFVESKITPQIILGLLVTPLIFEAAFHLRWKDLRRDLILVLALAVPGVVLTTLLVGAFFYAETDIVGSEIPIQIAFLFGAMMAATDPVSVVALFRTLGVPKRLQVLLEGESLFNDGTAIVVFALVLSMSLSGGSTAQANEYYVWIGYIVDFILVAGGGLIIGMLLGWLVSQVIKNIDDPLIETTLTTVLAFGTYLIAEHLDVSGILAVVSAGLVSGNVGPRGMSPTTRILVTNFWEYMAFISNSILFLLIGLVIDITELALKGQSILLAILAVLLARAIIVYGLSWLGRDIPLKWRHVLFWGGLRGAISLALALSLPLALGYQVRSTLQNLAFGVVLFSILVQGLTMEPLVRKLGLTKRSEMQEEYERRHARAVAARAAYNHIEKMHREGLISHHSWELISPILKNQADALITLVEEVMEFDPDVETEELDTARREALRAQRSSIIGLLNDGVISEEVFSELAQEIDDQLAQSQTSWVRGIQDDEKKKLPVKRLLAAVVQIQDAENAVKALNTAHMLVMRLSSSGGFLGRRNTTLLIGVPKDQEGTAVAILNQNCRQRVEFVATPLEVSPDHLPHSTQVNVGGATIFTIDVERYEEF
jgi:CPA1 family monovalent cation:H+ antiporter